MKRQTRCQRASVEPAESDLMRQKPRDPKASLMDRPMAMSVLASAAGLFAAVSVAYLVTYYSGASLVHAQSVAFVTWLLGHVLLAFNLRSERQPLAQMGEFSNQVMTVRAAAAIVLALAATNVRAL